MVGTTVDPDDLTVTIAFGASLFDGRYGLAGRSPDGLTRMPRFPDDDIDEARAHGDVLLTINARNRDTVVHALRELLRPVRGAFVDPLDARRLPRRRPRAARRAPQPVRLPRRDVQPDRPASGGRTAARSRSCARSACTRSSGTASACSSRRT